MYDRTVGALVPIGRALTNWLFESQASTNEIIVKIWDTHTVHRLNFDLFQIFRAKFWPFLNFEGFPHGRAESAVFYRTNHVVRLGLVATMWWGLVWLQRFDFIGENFDPHQC